MSPVRESEVARATSAAVSVATSCGLAVHDVTVLQVSNKLALRLLPCDVMARVAVGADLQPEIDLALRLVDASAPVVPPEPRVEPRVQHRDGFAITLWSYRQAVSEVSERDYAEALQRLHAAMRTIEAPAPHARDRVTSALEIVTDPHRSPRLADADRELLAGALRRFGAALDSTVDDQLLHGEPHPGNLLGTAHGPLFIDLETCCRGPVEFDVAHAPVSVAAHYPGLDPRLLDQCRTLMLAMITAWRWDRTDRLPDGRRLGHEGLAQLADQAGAGG